MTTKATEQCEIDFVRTQFDEVTQENNHNERRLVLKYENSDTRQGAQTDVLHSVAYYAEALELFNHHVITRFDPDASYELSFKKVSEGSVQDHFFEKLISKISKIYHGDDFLSALTESDDVEGIPSFYDKKATLEAKLNEFFEMEGIILDDLVLAQVLQLLNKAGKLVRSDEKVSVYEFESEAAEQDNDFSNVYSFNSRFSSSVKPKDLERPKIYKHNGKDILKVLVIKNFGASKWKFKSTLTNDIYEANFSDQKWLREYQLGNKTNITAKHLIEVNSSYTKYEYSDKTVIKYGIIEDIVDILIDEDFDNNEITGNDFS
ncbi:hypothetical protein AB4485_03430 [Vibrio cyclitrophicus]